MSAGHFRGLVSVWTFAETESEDPISMLLGPRRGRCGPFISLRFSTGIVLENNSSSLVLSNEHFNTQIYSEPSGNGPKYQRLCIISSVSCSACLGTEWSIKNCVSAEIDSDSGFSLALRT
jgi:hypothetical protein